jgi:uncharacterized protein YbjT (DUF2867 family)
MFLITGATGHIGGELARILQAQGHEVRAFLRDPDRAAHLPDGIERVAGDLDRPDTVAAALDGVDAVFHMQADHGTAQTETMVRETERAGVRRIVALSSMGAGLEPMPIMGTWFAAREEVLAASGLDVTLLRPSTLMTNALQWAPAIRDTGTVTDATGPGRLSSVDTDDVAAVAAVALTDDGHIGQTYTLTGQELLTSPEQVEILARVLGRDIAFVDQTPAQFAAASVEHGTPQEAADAMEDLNELFRNDGTAFLTDDVERVTGRAPGSFEAWCRTNTAAFR